MNLDEAARLEEDAAAFWDSFYSQHDDKFFKDRHWLFTEVPELSAESRRSTETSPVDSEVRNYPGKSASFRILEVGCGVGNTVFPLLEAYAANTEKFVYGCDFSAKAIEIVKANADYDQQRCHAFVADISSSDAQFPFPDESLDIILLIFVLSAINPQK